MASGMLFHNWKPLQKKLCPWPFFFPWAGHSQHAMVGGSEGSGGAVRGDKFKDIHRGKTMERFIDNRRILFILKCQCKDAKIGMMWSCFLELFNDGAAEYWIGSISLRNAQVEGVTVVQSSWLVHEWLFLHSRVRGNAYCNFGDSYELEEAEPDNVIYLAVKSPSNITHTA